MCYKEKVRFIENNKDKDHFQNKSYIDIKYDPILQPPSFNHTTLKYPQHTTTKSRTYVDKDSATVPGLFSMCLYILVCV